MTYRFKFGYIENKRLFACCAWAVKLVESNGDLDGGIATASKYYNFDVERVTNLVTKHFDAEAKPEAETPKVYHRNSRLAPMSSTNYNPLYTDSLNGHDVMPDFDDIGCFPDF